MPAHITREQMIGICVNAFRKNPKLAQCDPRSVVNAIRQAAETGLMPDGLLGHAYLVPYKTECTLIPGYKGYIDLARRSSEIADFRAECVYEGDQFSYTKGLTPTLTHQPNEDNPQDNDKQITHVYCVVKTRGGVPDFEVWSRAKLEGHAKKFSAAYRAGKQDSPWFTNWKEMAMKTLIRYMVNRGRVPLSVEVRKLAMQDELIDHSAYLETSGVRASDDPRRAIQNLSDLTQAMTGGAAASQQPELQPLPPPAIEPPKEESQSAEPLNQPAEPDIWDQIEISYQEAAEDGRSLWDVYRYWAPRMNDNAELDTLNRLHEKKSGFDPSKTKQPPKTSAKKQKELA